MALPDPTFTINSTGGLSSVAVSASGAVVAELTDISGVAPVAWEIERTDELHVPADYTFVQSGSVGQTYTGTALGVGTAGVIKVTVAGGYDPTTDTYSDELVLRRKFYVPTAGSLEVMVPGETAETDYIYLSDSTYGGVKPINELMRSALSGLVGNGMAARAATTGALPAHTFVAGVITASANGALPAQDNVSLSDTETLLVKNEGAADPEHGLYRVTQIGDAGSPFILTRHEDADSAAEMLPGFNVYIQEGDSQALTIWRMTTPSPITLNTTALEFSNRIYITPNRGIYSYDNAFGIVQVLRMDASDNLVIGDNDVDLNHVIFRTQAGKEFYFQISGSTKLTVSTNSSSLPGALAIGASPSTTGALRLTAADGIYWRGSGAFNLLGLKIATDTVTLGDNDPNLAGVNLSTPTGTSTKILIAGATNFEFSETYLYSIRDIQLASAASFDCVTNGAYLKPRRLSQSALPTPAASELMLHRDSDDNTVALLYNDATEGNKVLAKTTPAYGSIYVANGVTAQGSIGTGYVTITGFATNGASSSDVTPDHTADSLTVNNTGLYCVSFDISFSGTVTTTFTMAIAVDGTEDESLALQRYLSASDVGSASIHGILAITSGEAITVSVKADGASKSITPVFMRLVLHRIGY